MTNLYDSEKKKKPEKSDTQIVTVHVILTTTNFK